MFGFIGLGNMGGPLARNLAHAGEDVLVYSRDAGRLAACTAEGCRAANNKSDLAKCDVLCTCLPLPGHVLETVLGEDGLYARMDHGSIHVEFSTIDPATAHQMVDAAKEKGIAYVQVTVGKTPQMAAKCEEPLFIGGDRAAVVQLMPVFERIGKPKDVGSVDASCAVKLLSNLVGMANLALLAEGMRIGTLAGMDLPTLVELLQETGARSFQLDVRGPWIAASDYAARFGVSLAAKDLRLGCAMARSWNYEPKMMEQALAYFEEAREKGLGEEDCCAVYKTLS